MKVVSEDRLSECLERKARLAVRSRREEREAAVYE